MGKVLIVYATRSEETKGIADLIAEGVRISGHQVDVRRVSEIKDEEGLKGYDAYVFGSSTYHGEMITSMKQLLFIAERAELQGKAGGLSVPMAGAGKLPAVSLTPWPISIKWRWSRKGPSCSRPDGWKGGSRLPSLTARVSAQ